MGKIATLSSKFNHIFVNKIPQEEIDIIRRRMIEDYKSAFLVKDEHFWLHTPLTDGFFAVKCGRCGFPIANYLDEELAIARVVALKLTNYKCFYSKQGNSYDQIRIAPDISRR